MANFSKLVLSGSTDGRNIKVVATATPGTTIHTATTATGSLGDCDEVWIWAGSTSASPINMTIQTSTTDESESLNVRVPPAYAGLTLVVPGLPYRNGVVLTATAATANRINLTGYINRVTSQ